MSTAEQTAAKAFGQLHWQRLGGGSEDQDSEYTDSLALQLEEQAVTVCKPEVDHAT